MIVKLPKKPHIHYKNGRWMMYGWLGSDGWPKVAVYLSKSLREAIKYFEESLRCR